MSSLLYSARKGNAQVNSPTPMFSMSVIFLSALAYWRKSLQIDPSIRFSVIKNLGTEGKISVIQVIPKTLKITPRIERAVLHEH